MQERPLGQGMSSADSSTNSFTTGQEPGGQIGAFGSTSNSPPRATTATQDVFPTPRPAPADASVAAESPTVPPGTTAVREPRAATPIVVSIPVVDQRRPSAVEPTVQIDSSHDGLIRSLREELESIDSVVRLVEESPTSDPNYLRLRDGRRCSASLFFPMGCCQPPRF